MPGIGRFLWVVAARSRGLFFCWRSRSSASGSFVPRSGHPRGHRSFLLTRLYAPSGDFAEPAYAARTSHRAAVCKQIFGGSGCSPELGIAGTTANFAPGPGERRRRAAPWNHLSLSLPAVFLPPAAFDRGRGWSLVHARHALAERGLQSVGRPCFRRRSAKASSASS